jgi:hypothetical protein
MSNDELLDMFDNLNCRIGQLEARAGLEQKYFKNFSGLVGAMKTRELILAMRKTANGSPGAQSDTPDGQTK